MELLNKKIRGNYYELSNTYRWVGGLITNEEGKILMVNNPRRGWEFPGGQVEVGETLTEGLIREVKEETGINIEIISLVAVNSSVSMGIQYDGVSPLPTIVTIDFIGRALSGEPTISEESIEVGWFDKEKVIHMEDRQSVKDRLKFLFNYDGKVVYRAYEKNPYVVKEEAFV